ncbi:hypothetical protein B4102_3177 [Heyndrickxia sporothermodurans]|uniref:Uncharacterized protein n=1 Tax=Heyndrickxia sporothermodurans TaxID=46224 RepID=A0A150KZH5_9BACI|nr:hypothetical protein B4102_3177 [Heyndrickxia sporothermodurans]
MVIGMTSYLQYFQLAQDFKKRNNGTIKRSKIKNGGICMIKKFLVIILFFIFNGLFKNKSDEFCW